MPISEGNGDLSSEEHRELSLVDPEANLLPGAHEWLVWRLLHWQSAMVQSVHGLCLNPRTSMPLRRWHVGMALAEFRKR